MTFEDAKALLIDARGNERASKKLANNTYAERISDNEIAIRLHATYVVRFRPGETELDTGGWFTVTTKARMNDYSAFRVHSERGRWVVTLHEPTKDEIGLPRWEDLPYGSAEYDAAWKEYRAKRRAATRAVSFFDGIRISDAGEVLNPRPADLEEAEEKERAKTKKDIRAFVTLAMAKLAEGLPLPSGGDCWYCAMQTAKDHKPLGDSLGDVSHLQGHIEEGYIVPSLLWNAVAAKGYLVPALILGATTTSDKMGEGREMSGSVKRALTNYLTARLVPSETRGFKVASNA